MKAAELDKRFDDGEDLSAQVDWGAARRPNVQVKRVNVDFPAWVVSGLDQQARDEKFRTLVARNGDASVDAP